MLAVLAHAPAGRLSKEGIIYFVLTPDYRIRTLTTQSQSLSKAGQDSGR
jgi:hypothetical protein